MPILPTGAWVSGAQVEAATGVYSRRAQRFLKWGRPDLAKRALDDLNNYRAVVPEVLEDHHRKNAERQLAQLDEVLG